jgi:Transposase DDE domain group 1
MPARRSAGRQAICARHLGSFALDVNAELFGATLAPSAQRRAHQPGAERLVLFFLRPTRRPRRASPATAPTPPARCSSRCVPTASAAVVRSPGVERGEFVTAGNSPLGSERAFRGVCIGNSLKSLESGSNSATANQVRLALHTAAFWLMHGVRAAIPRTSPLAKCEFATIRERLIKIGARVIEHIARIRIQLPTSCPEGALFRAVALGLMPSGP